MVVRGVCARTPPVARVASMVPGWVFLGFKGGGIGASASRAALKMRRVAASEGSGVGEGGGYGGGGECIGGVGQEDVREKCHQVHMKC